VDVRGLEPLTPCLQSVNQPNATDSYGLLSCSVFFAFRTSSQPVNSYRVRWFVIEVCTKLCTKKKRAELIA